MMGVNNYYIQFLLQALVVLYFVSCVPHEKETQTNELEAVDSMQLLYAKGFKIKYYDGFKEVLVLNPWEKDRVFARYYLIESDSAVVPEQGVRLQMPVQQVAISSSTHIEFLRLLNVLQSVRGVCSPELIYNAFLREEFTSGRLTNLGDAFNINVEKTLQLQPDMVMMSGYKQDDPYAERILHAGIPVVYNNEWMEHSLLARAEWIKFIAAFYDKESQADSVFELVRKQYVTMRKKAGMVHMKPRVMSGSNFRGTWYMPGGNSYMAQLIMDAGGAYFYEDDDTAGSIPLHIETVIANFAYADVWIDCHFETIDDLIARDRKHALFKPVENKRVYHFNKRLLPSGANDYWESAVARPDWLLMDVIHMLHSDVLPDHQLIYAAPLK